jgi:hypothetical protein
VPIQKLSGETLALTGVALWTESGNSEILLSVLGEVDTTRILYPFPSGKLLGTKALITPGAAPAKEPICKGFVKLPFLSESSAIKELLLLKTPLPVKETANALPAHSTGGSIGPKRKEFAVGLTVTVTAAVPRQLPVTPVTV